jgi:hypothetical protein
MPEYKRRYEPPHGFDEPDCVNCTIIKDEVKFRSCQSCRSLYGVIYFDLKNGSSVLSFYPKIYDIYAKYLGCEPALTRVIPALEDK